MGTAAFAPWRCPLCGAPLAGDVTLKCPSGHCFDRAKEGYWHLLPVQNTRTKAPGDSKEMVAARRAFLSLSLIHICSALTAFAAFAVFSALGAFSALSAFTGFSTGARCV